MDEGVTWRIVYRVDADAVVIAEVFAKKTTQTPAAVLEACPNDSRNTTMRRSKKQRLEAKGWRFGSAQEFLGLSDEEAAYVEVRLRLADSLRRRRQKQHLSQTDVAKRLHSSQSRVAKMEGGDPSVSLDLLIRSLLALGASSRDVARAISGASLPRAS
jgi:ribosome-binding protein aMBF1 (putative translation factor)